MVLVLHLVGDHVPVCGAFAVMIVLLGTAIENLLDLGVRQSNFTKGLQLRLRDSLGHSEAFLEDFEACALGFRGEGFNRALSIAARSL